MRGLVRTPLKVLAFGQPHFARLNEQARALGLPIRFSAAFRRPLRRWGRLRAVTTIRPGRPEAQEIASHAAPGGSPWDRRAAWGTAEVVWRKIARVDAILVWNGSRGHGLMAAETARALGKTVVYIENGFFPDTVQIDLEGINYASSLARLDPHTLPEAGTCPIPFRQRPLGRDTGLDATPDLPEGLPEVFALFAAQVHDDTQITRFSPDFPTVDDAIRYAAAECAAAGIPLVVKEHPQDHGRIDRAPLKAELPDVRFLENADNAALIAACRAFITINSSLALQAVAAGKPVFTLGDAAYNVPDIARRIRPPETLHHALATAEFDDGLRRRYLAYLKNVALVPFNTRLATDEQLQAVATRVAEMLQAS